MPSTILPASPSRADLQAVAGSGDIGNVLAWLGTGIGFGLVSGWAVGYALKKVALLAALLLGLSFILVQLMVVNRFVTVDWKAVADSFGHASRSLSGPNASWWKLLVNNFPYAGSFGVGFFMGFKKG